MHTKLFSVKQEEKYSTQLLQNSEVLHFVFFLSLPILNFCVCSKLK